MISFPHYAVTNCITKTIILFAIQNTEVSAIDGAKSMSIYGDASKLRAIERFPLKGESVKGGSTVILRPHPIMCIFIGTVGYIGTRLFVRKIYATVKID